jgi:hypothetical protein
MREKPGHWKTESIFPTVALRRWTFASKKRIVRAAGFVLRFAMEETAL